jgi:hypothetical protein
LQLGTLDKEKVGTKIAFTRIPEKEEFSEWWVGDATRLCTSL